MKTIRNIIAFLIRRCFGIYSIHRPDNSATGEPSIYFANHSSNLDFLLIWASLPADIRAKTRPVAALDYWSRTPIRKWIACHLFNAVLIDRQTKMRRSNPLEPLLKTLANGDSLIIFPEGTRSLRAGKLGAFKSGLYRLHQQFPNSEVIPVWLQNAGRVYPKGALLPIPLLTKVRFGKPLAVTPKQIERIDYLKRAKAILSALQPTTV